MFTRGESIPPALLRRSSDVQAIACSFASLLGEQAVSTREISRSTTQPGPSMETAMQLEQTLRSRLEEKDILLMTHIVLGYPSFETNRQVIKQMVENGVDCIEMQIPFSEPMADGPVILKANQDSIAGGTTIADCLAFGCGDERCPRHTVSLYDLL